MPLFSGTQLGPYEVLSLLGAGGMGEVYRARDSQLARDVAIKVLANLTADPERLHRFEQEARAAAALNHPNILAVYQLGTHDGAPPVSPSSLVSLMQLERCLGHRQTRHADRLASQGFQGADEILPFVCNLKSFGLILFGQQERGHGAV
jgi:serine/threonine protein kinase